MPIPVTIISGFLGAGKTTLLNHLLRSQKGQRIAVIENELGEIGIDGSLVQGISADVFELSGGCICCTRHGELEEALSTLASKDIDYLLVETTGIADPDPVALAFLAAEEQYELDGIVVVVDVLHVERQMELHTEVRKQLALASTVLLNKTDLADSYQQDVARNIVRRINPEAQVIATSNGKVEPDMLLHQRAFDGNTTAKAIGKAKVQPNSQSLHLLVPTLPVGTIALELDNPIDLLKFNAWVSALMLFNKDRLYRIKGILWVEDVEERILFQSVHDQYMSQSLGAWPADEPRKSKLVFIGQHLDRDSLAKGLQQCMA